MIELNVLVVLGERLGIARLQRRGTPSELLEPSKAEMGYCAVTVPLRAMGVLRICPERMAGAVVPSPLTPMGIVPKFVELDTEATNGA